jgi:MerR family transcriptional regulator, light-induced transcriptional regulator
MTIPPAFTALYTPHEAEQRTGVQATTLRQWERRYGLPRPSRNASGYRLYSALDLECISYLQQQLAGGVPISRATALARERYGTVAHPEPADLDELVQALLRADHQQAGRALAQATARLGPDQMLLAVVQPALVMIGQLWECGEITVAHEHQASAYLRSYLTVLLEAAGSNDLGPRVVAACGPGEHHEIGLMILSILLRRRGVQVQYLGANTPLADLDIYARQVDAQAVLISVNSTEALDQYLTQQAALPGPAQLTYLGGSVFGRLDQATWTRQPAGTEILTGDALDAAQRIISALSGRPADARSADGPPGAEL